MTTTVPAATTVPTHRYGGAEHDRRLRRHQRPQRQPALAPRLTPVSGEGLLRLALEAPGTSWGPGPASSTVVDATLTDLTTHQIGPKQQFVLFWGSAPFIYAAFVGPVRSTDVYSLTISVEPPAAQGGLSQAAAGTKPPVGFVSQPTGARPPDQPPVPGVRLCTGHVREVYLGSPRRPPADLCHSDPGSRRRQPADVRHRLEPRGCRYGLPAVPGVGDLGTHDRHRKRHLLHGQARTGSVSGAQYLWGGEPAVGFPDSQTRSEGGRQAICGYVVGRSPGPARCHGQ